VFIKHVLVSYLFTNLLFHYNCLFIIIYSPGAQNGETKEWAMIELQGTLETRHPVPLSGRFIGDLHFTHKVLLHRLCHRILWF
jgi:hypothetical protein